MFEHPLSGLFLFRPKQSFELGGYGGTRVPFVVQSKACAGVA